MFRQSLFLNFCPRNIIWNFKGLALIPFSVNQSTNFRRSPYSLVMTALTILSNAYIVVSSAKLRIFYSCSKWNISFIKILKKKGPRTEPCGTPIETHFGELYANHTLTFWVLFVK